MNREAELRAPSRVACSDLLGIFDFPSIDQQEHHCNQNRENTEKKDNPPLRFHSMKNVPIKSLLIVCEAGQIKNPSEFWIISVNPYGCNKWKNHLESAKHE